MGPFGVQGQGQDILVSVSREGLSQPVGEIARVGTSALRLPFASATEYGLGKSGWVTAKFRDSDDVPVEMLIDWLGESFRAIAPKQVLKKLENGPYSRKSVPASRSRRS